MNLEACPYCGRPARLVQRITDRAWRVECTALSGCPAAYMYAGYPTQELAGKAWNTRNAPGAWQITDFSETVFSRIAARNEGGK